MMFHRQNEQQAFWSRASAREYIEKNKSFDPKLSATGWWLFEQNGA